MSSPVEQYIQSVAELIKTQEVPTPSAVRVGSVERFVEAISDLVPLAKTVGPIGALCGMPVVVDRTLGPNEWYVVDQYGKPIRLP